MRLAHHYDEYSAMDLEVVIVKFYFSTLVLYAEDYFIKPVGLFNMKKGKQLEQECSHKKLRA